MTTPGMNQVLQDLAAGRIDAAEAARRLDALKEPPAAPAASPADVTEPAAQDASEDGTEAPAEADAWAAATDRPQRPSHAADPFPAPVANPAQAAQAEGTRPVNIGGVDRITVRAVGRRVRIVGEPAVATLSADGPHVLRRNGTILEVSSDGEFSASLDGFSLLRTPRSLDDIRALGLGKELLLRVNPNILLDVEVTAGSLSIERVAHLGKVRVTAGGAKLHDVNQIDDALIQAGQATIKGTITTGRSRIRAESGSLSIQLGEQSDVTVKGEAQLGRVSWSGGHTGAGDEVVMGQGSARLDIEVVMGHAQVRIGSIDPAPAGSA